MLSGNAGITMYGTGALLLTNPNNTVNGITVNGGTLLVNDLSDTSLGNSPATITVNSVVLSGTGEIAQNVQMKIGSSLTIFDTADIWAPRRSDSGLNLAVPPGT